MVKHVIFPHFLYIFLVFGCQPFLLKQTMKQQRLVHTNLNITTRVAVFVMDDIDKNHFQQQEHRQGKYLLKNPAYGRQSISRPMRIVAPIPQQGGPRIPKNPILLKNGKKSSKTQKLQNDQRYANISDIPFDQRSPIHREAWFPPCFVRQNQVKINFFLRGNFRPFQNKNV